MAKIAVVCELNPFLPSQSSRCLRQVIEAHLSSSHEVLVITTYEGSPVDESIPENSRLEVVRPFERWNWPELFQTQGILQNFAPDVIHILNPFSRHRARWWSSQTSLPAVGKVIFGAKIVVSFFDLNLQTLKSTSLSWLLGEVDTITVSHPDQVNLLQSQLHSSRSPNVLWVPPLPTDLNASEAGWPHLQNFAPLIVAPTQRETLSEERLCFRSSWFQNQLRPLLQKNSAALMFMVFSNEDSQPKGRSQLFRPWQSKPGSEPEGRSQKETSDFFSSLVEMKLADRVFYVSHLSESQRVQLLRRADAIDLNFLNCHKDEFFVWASWAREKGINIYLDKIKSQSFPPQIQELYQFCNSLSPTHTNLGEPPSPMAESTHSLSDHCANLWSQCLL